MPNRSGNPESLKPLRKQPYQFESSLTNVHICKDQLRAFYKLFYLRFYDSICQWKKDSVATFYEKCEKHFYIKMTVTVIPVTITLRFALCFRAIRNSINFYKGIYSFANTVRIIVPCLYLIPRMLESLTACLTDMSHIFIHLILYSNFSISNSF